MSGVVRIIERNQWRVRKSTPKRHRYSVVEKQSQRPSVRDCLKCITKQDPTFAPIDEVGTLLSAKVNLQ